MSWDEPVHSGYAERVIDYVRSFGKDKSCNDYYDLKYYGPTTDLVAASIYRWTPENKILVRHLLSAFLAIGSFPALFQIGKRLGNPWIGVASCLCLILCPRFVGHAFVNLKDIPFATAYAWSIWAMMKYLWDDQSWENVFWCIVTVGAAAMIRAAGLPLLAATFVIGAIAAATLGKQRLQNKIFLHGLAILAGAWILMVIPWPWAHESPIRHPLATIVNSSSFHTVVPILYDGESINSDELPRSYLPKFFAITTPIAILAFAAYGFLSLIWQHWMSREEKDHDPKPLALVLIWVALPLLLYVALRPNTYDGIRHFLFLLPGIACLAGLGFVDAWQRFNAWTARFGLTTIAIVSSLAILAGMVQLHPYQLSHFNGFVGGVKGANGKYDTEYWLTSYRAAMEWINEKEAENEEPFSVLVGSTEQATNCAAAFAPETTTVKATNETGLIGPVPHEYRYYIGSYRFDLDDNFPKSPIVHRVQRDGVVFCVVRKR